MRKLVVGLAVALSMTLAPVMASDVIDPKVECLFGSDWESQKVTLGDSVEQFDAVFGEYLDEDGVGDRTYRIDDCASLSVDVEDTGQVSGITIFPYNSGENVESKPETIDDRDFTDEQAALIVVNFLPGDAVVNQMCPTFYPSLEMMGTSDELYSKVYPETYAGTHDETPTQGSYSVQLFINENKNNIDDVGSPRIEFISVALESWELQC